MVRKKFNRVHQERRRSTPFFIAINKPTYNLMEVLFIKYRKSFLAASVFMFLYFLYEVYRAIGIINSNKTGQGFGALLDDGITLFVAIYFFINVRKANKQFNEENAARDQNNTNSNGL